MGRVECETPFNTQSPLQSVASDSSVKEEDGATVFTESSESCLSSSKSVIKSEVRERRVEVGRFNKIKPIDVFYHYENFPTWLLLIDALVVSTITIGGMDNMDSFVRKTVEASQCSKAFLEWIVDRIGWPKFVFVKEKEPIKTEPTLHLLSGSLSYICSYLQRSVSEERILFVVDGHSIYRLRNGRLTGVPELPQVTWYRIRHVTVGGPTSYMALLGTAHFQISPPGSTLRRTIRDIWNSGTRAVGVRSAELAGALDRRRNVLVRPELYLIDDVVLVDALWWPVYHQTHMFVTGWGKRALSVSELAAAYGYPRHIHPHIERWVFALPPFGVLVDCFRSAAAVELPVLPKLKVPPVTVPIALPTAAWLESIQRWLPHAWTGVGTGSQADIKQDDASVPTHLWDQRILLIYPQADRLIIALRKLCFRRTCRNAMTDLRHYLTCNYGEKWCSMLYDTALGRVSSCQVRAIRRAGGENDGVDKPWKAWGVHKEEKEPEKVYEEEELEIGYEREREREVYLKLRRDVSMATEVMTKLASSSWWEWNSGSSLIFWRWNPEEIKLARDGMEPFIQGTLPRWEAKKGKRIQEPKLELIVKKLKTIVQRNYVMVGKVSSWTDFFEVPKGNDDIRLVYNGTSCGLNQALWSTNFWLPFPRSASRVLDFNSYSGDMDLGEMFHNFPLHSSLQEYSGIDLTSFEKHLELPEGTGKSYRWTRTWMGARSSPYSCVRFYHLAEEFVRGDHTDPTNELRWDHVILNLPGDENYNPSKPRVQKWDVLHMWIAGELITFVDDGRAIGRTLEHTWRILKQICSRLQYKGIQVALRKVHEPKLDPGPWAGAVFETTNTSVTKSVTIEKWNKGKGLVEKIWNQLNTERWATEPLSYKELEIARGFLCHLSMTFEAMIPYLKGFHLTLASHLRKRDSDGWKYSDKTWQIYLDHQVEEGRLDPEEAHRLLNQGTGDVKDPPKTILPVKQLKDDIFALREFLSPNEPPRIQERSTSVQVVRYGFGDASGSGFGSTIETPEGLKYRIGVWGGDDESESSNYKELENVVTTIEDEASCGNLAGAVLFFFTDNSTVESALYKGNSSSRKLFLLVVRFRKLQFMYGTQIVVSHVSGKRMIQQGTDGVSRGNLNEGVGAGMSMIGFIPLHLGALLRHPPLWLWLTSWMGQDTEFLEPQDWFTRGHDHDGGSQDKRGFWSPNIRSGIFVWAPPPAAAEVALEELRKAVIKRQRSTHVFVCPRLMTTEWMKQLYKASDLVLSIPAGSIDEAWSEPMHESLTIGFIFPLLPCKPWQRKSPPQMFYVERHLSKMFKGEGMAAGDFLREFFQKQRNLSSLPELLVCRVLYLRK